MHPKFRIFRHLLILLLLGIIVMRGLFENSEFSPGWNAITLINITLIFLFWGIICLNTYILIPRLLFKGKYWTYAICLLSCTLFLLFMMFLVIFISKFYFPVFHEAIKPNCNLFLLLNRLNRAHTIVKNLSEVGGSHIKLELICVDFGD